MKKINQSLQLVLLAFLLGIEFLDCASKKETVAPDQVEAQFSKARAVLEEIKSLPLPGKVNAYYENLMTQAETAKKQGNFELAMTRATQLSKEGSELLQLWKDQEQKYQELMQYNPPEPMTYHYRSLMSQAISAGEQGKIDLFKNLVKQAGEQAGMSLQLLKEQLATIREKLNRTKEELETLYPVNYPLIKRYWEAESKYQKRDFQDLNSELDQLLKEIQNARNLSYITDRMIMVNAPQEYIKQWGDVRIYQEITPEGKLKTIVDTVPNGMRVKFLRLKIFSPELNFCYVEVPATGKQGWIAEKYLNIGETRY